MPFYLHIKSFFFGAIATLSFEPFNVKFIIFLSYAYIMRSLFFDSKNDLKTKLIFWAAGHWAIGMSWTIVSIYYYGNAGFIVTLLLYFLLLCVLILIFSTPIFLYRFINSKNNIFKIFTIASVFLIIDFSKDYLLDGLPWILPGYIFTDTYLQYFYSIWGVAGFSFILYLVSAILAIYLHLNRIKFLTYTGLIILTTLPIYDPNIENGDIKISIVQPSSDPFLKYKENYYEEIENNIFELNAKISKDTELIVLPEAELPYVIQDYRFNLFKNNLLTDIPLIGGAWSYKDGNFYNSLVNFHTLDEYNKQHLVLFGEYLPISDKIRDLVPFFRLPMSNISKGSNNQNLLTINDMNLATLICYDAVFANTVRKRVKSSNLIVNISNDTWFGGSIGPYQHLNIARIRSIENNKWTIRATNNGYSAIISNKGTIVSLSDKNSKQILEGHVQLIEDRTFYSLYGYILFYLISCILVLLAIYRKFKNA